MASLLERLGGRDALVVVVAGLVGRLHADRRLAHHFDRVSRLRHEAHLVELLAGVLGESGSPEPPAGAGRPIEGATIDTFVAYLIETLAAAGVGEGLTDEIAERVAHVRAHLTSAAIVG